MAHYVVISYLLTMLAAVEIGMLVGPPTVRGVAIKFCADMHAPLGVNPNDFGDALTIPLEPQADRHLWFRVNIF